MSPVIKKADQRTLFAMNPTERSRYTIARGEARENLYMYRMQWAFGYSDAWDQGSLIDNYDEHIANVIDRFQCMADVRGYDYVDDQISDHLGELVYPSNPHPESIGGTYERNWNMDFSDRQQLQIERELDGLEPLPGKRGRKRREIS